MLNVVIGATGHLGNVLVRELLKDGERVRAVVLPGDNLRPIEGLDVEIVEGDITKPDSINEALKGADIVYHMAGAVVITSYHMDLLEKVNVEGTKNVINACFENGIKRLVYTSSVHALHEPRKGIVIDEKQPFDPEQVFGNYSKTKAKASIEVLKSVKKGLDAVLVCPTGIIGPYDFSTSQIGQLIIDFVQNRLKTYIDGAYDFADVRDVARGHILAAKNGKTGESYILSGKRITVFQLIQLLGKISGAPGPRFKMPYFLALATAPLTPIYYFFSHTKPIFTTYSIKVLASNSEISSEKAQKELGYKSRDVEQSLKDAYLWLKKEKYL